MFTRPDEICLVVELYRGGSLLIPDTDTEGPGYPAYLVHLANPGVALQTQLSLNHSFIHLLSDPL